MKVYGRTARTGSTPIMSIPADGQSGKMTDGSDGLHWGAMALAARERRAHLAGWQQ